jgi:hypothetical protein
MATAEALLDIVGSPVESATVRALVVADKLSASAEPDLEEGEPLRAYLANPALGYQLMHHSGRVATVFLYVEPAEGFEPFPGPLPGGIGRGASRAQVRARFGVPERNGVPTTIPGLGRLGAWDRFAIGAVRVHFQYTDPDERVQLITVMSAADAP